MLFILTIIVIVITVIVKMSTTKNWVVKENLCFVYWMGSTQTDEAYSLIAPHKILNKKMLIDPTVIDNIEHWSSLFFPARVLKVAGKYIFNGYVYAKIDCKILL